MTLDLGGKPSHFVAQYSTLILSASRALDEADNKYNVTYFRFEGDPIPPLNTSTAIAQPKQQMPELSQNTIRDLHDGHFLLDSKLNKGSTTIEDISKCSVTNRDIVPRSVTLRGISDSLVLLKCKGPIMIKEAKNSIFVLSCQQLRLHSSEECSLFLGSENRGAIIEASKKISFGTFDEQKEIVSEEKSSLNIHDFSWPNRDVPSPNFIVLSSPFSVSTTNAASLKERIETSMDAWTKKEDLG